MSNAANFSIGQLASIEGQLPGIEIYDDFVTLLSDECVHVLYALEACMRLICKPAFPRTWTLNKEQC